ncbi:MAG: cell division protein FtsA [bacterium]
MAKLKFQENKYYLSLLMGTETVRALIFCVSHIKRSKKITLLGVAEKQVDRIDEVFDILFSSGTKLSFSGNAANTSFLDELAQAATTEAIDEACESAARNLGGKNGTHKIKKGLSLFAVELPADVVRARAFRVFYERENPGEVIKKEEEKKIFKNIREKAEQRAREFYSEEFSFPPQELQIVSYRINEISIDGYCVPRASGYKGKILEGNVLIAVLPEQYRKNVLRLIGQPGKERNTEDSLNCDFLEIIHSAETFSFAIAGKKISGIFIEVGGAWTKIFLVNEGKVFYFSAFEKAGKDFSHVISDRLGVSMKEARRLKENYSQKSLSEGARARMREIILPEAKAWFIELREEIKKASEVEHNGISYKGGSLPPADIFLFGGGSYLPEVEEVIESGDWEGVIPAFPRIKFLYQKDVDDWVKDRGLKIDDLTKTIKGPKDVGITILSYYGQ